MLRKILEILGFRSLINEVGKGFSDLTVNDIPSLLDAHLNGSNSHFDEDALFEFLLMKPPTDELSPFWAEMQKIDKEHGDAGLENGLETEAGRNALREYIKLHFTL